MPPPCDWCLGAGQLLEPVLDEWGEPLWGELVAVVCLACEGSGVKQPPKGAERTP